jgi:actin-like ATPase involved in cell morphogenesis
MKAPALAIDFGTSRTKVAYFDEESGKAKLVEIGREILTVLPSVFYIPKEGQGERLVGDDAQDMVDSDPEGIVLSLKKELHKLGKKRCGPDRPAVERIRLAADLFSHIYQRCRTEVFFNETISRCRLTVPVDFKAQQREAIKSAAQLGGFQEVSIVEEPVSAAEHWLLSQPTEKFGDSVVVCDVGGGTTDFAFLRYVGGSFQADEQVLSAGFPLGGNDLDESIWADICEGNPAMDQNKDQTAGFLIKIRRERELMIKVRKPEIRITVGGRQCLFSRSIIEAATCEFVERVKTEALRFLEKIDNQTQITDAPILLVGGASRLHGLNEALNSLNRGKVFLWNYCDYATVLGAVEIETGPVVKQHGQDKTIVSEVGVKIGATVPQNTTMNPELYEIQRNNLLSLMDEALRIPQLPVDQVERISLAKRKALENQFVVALVGEFQGGKSTTFNALCDGREVSPRGIGLKTSACVMAAMNISVEKESERAEFEWKTEKELLLSFIELIENRIRTKHSERFSMAKAPNICEAIDLGSDLDRNLLKGMLLEEWTLWKSNKGGYSEDRLDQLQIGSLVMKYIGTTEYEQLRSQKEFSIADAGRLVTFPRDWYKRWNEGSSQFQMHDCAFAFIARVTFRIRSKNLARTGSVILDCPGLFASAWDTTVARTAMFSADAIWYLFNGSKELTDGDVKALRMIKQNGWEKKLFFSMNLRDRSLQIIKERISPANVEKLTNLGFNISTDSLNLYDAFLALRASQGTGLLNKSLDEHTIECLKVEAQTLEVTGTEPAAIWEETVRQQLLTLKPPTRQQFQGLDLPSIAVIRGISNLDDMLFKIEQTMISGKARSILIDQGSEYATQSLKAFEGFLQLRETAAEESKEHFQRKLDDANQKTDAFFALCRDELEPLNNNVIESALYNDLIERALNPAFDEVSEIASSEIYASLKWMDALFNKEKLSNDAGAIVKKNIDEIVPPRTTNWLSELIDGNNEIYNNSIITPSQRILRRISEEWNEVVKDNKDILLFQNIETQKNLDINKALGAGEIQLNQDLDISFESFQAIGLYLAGYIANVVLASASHPIMGIIILAISLIAHGEVEKRIVAKIKSSIAESLRTAVGGEIKEKLLPVLAKFRTSVRNQIEAGTINVISSELERRKGATKSDFEKSQAQRETIASECRGLREGTIAPLRKRIESFQHNVESLLFKRN